MAAEPSTTFRRYGARPRPRHAGGAPPRRSRTARPGAAPEPRAASAAPRRTPPRLPGQRDRVLPRATPGVRGPRPSPRGPSPSRRSPSGPREFHGVDRAERHRETRTDRRRRSATPIRASPRSRPRARPGRVLWPILVPGQELRETARDPVDGLAHGVGVAPTREAEDGLAAGSPADYLLAATSSNFGAVTPRIQRELQLLHAATINALPSLPNPEQRPRPRRSRACRRHTRCMRRR